ncbi:hypothetical protein [Paenibacillus sp. ISL-20]|uniref:hypothetical protein n=1 Tax=Paenibacillus sp. ISL-20 TaxID=2819163 RepID=UPI001BEB8E74|nr:hypothetical protein [Paenibacillus sp. ISL-20]
MKIRTKACAQPFIVRELYEKTYKNKHKAILGGKLNEKVYKNEHEAILVGNLNEKSYKNEYEAIPRRKFARKIGYNRA